MTHSWVEISRSAILHNLTVFQRLAGSTTTICPVIKSNAYGHGMQEVASIIGSQTKFLAVASSTEALHLKTKSNIIVLSYVEDQDIKAAITRGIRLPVYSYKAAQNISRIAQRLHKKAFVHIKVDTGATRVGITLDKAVAEISRIVSLPGLIVEGIYSHFATADDGAAYMRLQDASFQKVIHDLKGRNIFFKWQHIACTGAILQHHSDEYAIARLGIGLYGLWPSAKLQKQSRLSLRPALTWKTKIVDMKTITSGTSVGYGRSFIARKPMKVAVLPIGYWEGYDRHLSNKGSALVHNQVCPVVGRVCMNLTMVDVTKVKKATIGSEVTLLSADQKYKAVSADVIAKHIGTINYEVVTRINPLLQRIIVS